MTLLPSELIPEIDRSNAQLTQLAERLSQNSVEFGKALDALPEDVRAKLHDNPNLRLIETCEELFLTAATMLEGAVRPYESLTECLKYIDRNHKYLGDQAKRILELAAVKDTTKLQSEISSLTTELAQARLRGLELIVSNNNLRADNKALKDMQAQNEQLSLINAGLASETETLKDRAKELGDQNSKLRRNFWIALSGGIAAAIASGVLIFKDDIHSYCEDENAPSSSEIHLENPNPVN